MKKTLAILGAIVIVASFSFFSQPEVSFAEGTSAADEPSRTINAANYTYCRTVTSNNNGYTDGIGTTTPLLFPLFASSTISSLAATSSSGRIQLVSADEPTDIVFTDEASCSFSTSIDAIPHYFEKYASTTGEFSVHLGTSNISSTTAKTLAMYYGNSGATNLNSPGQTFATSSAMGIVSHWDLSVPGYATTTSPDFTDSTYNNNHGSSAAMNQADLVSGQVDGSLDFDGTGDNVSVTDNDSLDFGTGDMSISVWIRPNSVTRLKQAIVDKTDGTAASYRFNISDATGGGDRLKFTRGAAFADGIQSNDNVLVAGVWQHIAAVVNTSGTDIVTFYVNGVAQGSGNLLNSSFTNANPLMIGQKGYSGSSVVNFDGSIDDVRVYNRALSMADIQTIYNTTSRSDVFWTFGNEETQSAPAGETATPPRVMHLFEGFKIKLISGRLIIQQR